jgi:uncharacterized protein YndB with AHSA1/START domain
MMTDAVETGPIVRELYIEATPATVFAFFTEPAKLTRWLSTSATLDPRPGGVCHQVHTDENGQRFEMEGEFVEVVPFERVVFTWGFADPEVNLPPGSTRVEVTLVPEGAGTRLRLEHHDVPASERAGHEEGWTEKLDQLAKAVAS